MAIEGSEDIDHRAVLDRGRSFASSQSTNLFRPSRTAAIRPASTSPCHSDEGTSAGRCEIASQSRSIKASFSLVLRASTEISMLMGKIPCRCCSPANVNIRAFIHRCSRDDPHVRSPRLRKCHEPSYPLLGSTGDRGVQFFSRRTSSARAGFQGLTTASRATATTLRTRDFITQNRSKAGSAAGECGLRAGRRKPKGLASTAKGGRAAGPDRLDSPGFPSLIQPKKLNPGQFVVDALICGYPT